MWETICNQCRDQMTETAFEMWIKPLRFIKLDSENVTLSCPGFKIDLIKEKYDGIIKKACTDNFGFDVSIIYVPEIESSKSGDQGRENDTDFYTYSKSDDLTNPAFTFNNFVVGSSNKMAFTASQRVAQSPGSIFNPLYIYGNSGLGKTHLLNAIINKMKENNPDANIIYMTSEDFTNELYYCIQTKTTNEFHNKYRRFDALFIDDIQFIAGKEATEEEFFHTFNALVKDGKQIVLTADRPPTALPKLTDRLKTRFESGLLVDIQTPDFETRVAIVKNKADYYHFSMPIEVCEYIAENIKNNVRKLESAVKNIYAYCTFNNIEKPTNDIARETLKDIINTDIPVSVMVDNIIDKVAFTYGVTAEQMKSERRDANINDARQTAMYLILEITGMSQQAIGEIFGRNHSTVNNALKNINNKIKNDSKYKNLIEDIKKNINDYQS